MKILSTLVFTFFLFFTSYAQGIHFGIGAGANYTNLVQDPFDVYSYGVGFQVNAIVEYKFCEKMSLRLEPGFESRKVESDVLFDDGKLTVNSITLPAMLTFSPVNKFTLMVGPEVAYILSSGLHVSSYVENTFGVKNQDFDFGIKAGLSYKISEHFELGLRYYRGLRSSGIWDITDMNGNSIGQRLYYQGFSMSAFYRI